MLTVHFSIFWNIHWNRRQVPQYPKGSRSSSCDIESIDSHNKLYHSYNSVKTVWCLYYKVYTGCPKSNSGILKTRIFLIFICFHTHGAEHFLRICQLCSHSRTSQRIMEPESSLPRSKEPFTGPYPEPDRSNPYHPILSSKHVRFRNKLIFIRWGIVTPRPTPKLEDHSLSGWLYVKLRKVKLFLSFIN
jgi:hypothetical protein